MSSQGVFAGPGLAILVVLLGVIGLLIEPLIFLVFIIVLGYYLYRIEKRLSALEGPPGAQNQPSK